MNNERRKAGLKAKIEAAATAVFLRKKFKKMLKISEMLTIYNHVIS